MNLAVTDLHQIPMSQALASALARASEAASAMGAREVMLEHLLGALCDDQDAAGVLNASQIDIARLKSDIAGYLARFASEAPPMPGALAVSQDARRILEAAAAAARGGRRRDINGAIVLAAIVGDGHSVAAQMLQAQGLTFDGAIKALQTALAKAPAAPTPVPAAADDVLARARERVQSRATPSLRDIMNEMAPRPVPPPFPSPVAVPAAMPPDAARPPVTGPAAIPSALEQPPPQMSAPTHDVIKRDDEGALPVAVETQNGVVAPRPEVEPPRSMPPLVSSKPKDVAAPSPSATGTGMPEPLQPVAAAPLPPPASLAEGRADIFADMRRNLPAQLGPPPIPSPIPMASRYQPLPQSGALPGRLPVPSQVQPAPNGFGPPSAPGPRLGPADGMRASPQQGSQATGSARQRSKTEAGHIAENIPRTMRVAKTERIEIRLAKTTAKNITLGLEGGGVVWKHDIVVTQAMSVRLRAPEGGFFVETASPETQWIENNLSLSNDDYASWRFLVTPNARGWSRLQIIVSARTVGADGMMAETAMPDQVVEVKIRRNLKRAAIQWTGWVAAAVAGGVLAKFGEQGWTLAADQIQRLMN